MTPAGIVVEVVGWTGATLILSAYWLLSSGKFTGQSAGYQWMNVFGGAGFVINGWWHGALPSTALNVVWVMIGGVALWRIKAKQGSST